MVYTTDCWLTVRRRPRTCVVRGRGGRLGVAVVLAIAGAAAFGTDESAGPGGSAGPVTEYVNAPRLLISLLHEPYAAAVTPDGTHLATGHNDGSIVLWRVGTGRPVRSFLGPLAQRSTVGNE